ncbi:MAG: SDR family oxidoreductase [Elusimicrobia bacterium]|nr:SDR family oxidoreductase [Elusimicrobiota bacterium]
MIEFKNKVVIVTGGASGIGKRIAEQFYKQKAKVIIIDKNNCDIKYDFFYKGDITNKKVIVDFIKQVIKKYEKVDFIINNAGLSKGGLLSCSYENFLYVQKLSLAAPFMIVKQLINNLNKNAVIINISSSRAFQSQPDWESYGAAKGGIVALTHAMAVTLKGKARVNCISPGWIDTLNSNFSKEDKSQHPANTVGEPKDIANMVLFLCSNKAKFITGENINIDGGMSKLMVYHNDYGWQYKE